jgi:hypothetical protein
MPDALHGAANSSVGLFLVCSLVIRKADRFSFPPVGVVAVYCRRLLVLVVLRALAIF